MEDLTLLRLLENNSRYTTTDLATVLNETEEVVDAAIKRLEAENVICGYHTVVNWDKFNNEKVLAIIQVHADPEREAGYDRVASRIYQFPEVDSMYLLSGSVEFLVFIQGKTMQEVAHFVASKLATLDGVTGTNTLFSLKTYKSAGVIFDKKDSSSERLVVTP